ncbi:transport integral membrane protein [Catellatospora methionotrophica]|uniref:Transport integral membrane protein n=1 Tax=Catellatospora methionotrophica TaxID=121620 RepID=A0A8J3LEC1_9ACTN|nr:copper resistance protein CopC [Catellatospora methionotrophica]GIG13581.1 transport integral membrane protein [Catellatospora methionotrophica]
MDGARGGGGRGAAEAARRGRAKVRGLLAVVAFLALTLLPASPAYAHAALLRTSPPAGSVVPEAPREVALTFSEPVSPVADKIRIVGPDGQRADRGKPTVDGNVVKIQVREDAPKGTYLVSYRVISADSHPIPGGFTFSVGAPSATPTAVPDEKVDTTIRNLIAVAKVIGYAGLVMLVGPVLVLTLLWPARLSQRGPRRVMWAGFGTVAFATLAGLYLQAPYSTGGSLFGATGSDLGDVLGSQYGIALLMRLALLAVAAILVRPLLAGRDGVVDRVLLLAVAAAAALTWPLAGHPAASPVPAVSVVVDALHLAGAAVWLGGLLMLVLFLLRRADNRELGAILPIWSRWAALAVSTVLLAGVVSGLIQIGTPSALVDTTYGQLMIVKVVLVGLILVAAFFARRWTNNGAADNPRPLRRFVTTELAIAAVVLAVTGALTQTTPARTAQETAQLPAQPVIYSSTLTSSLYTLQVEVDPAKLGDNGVHLYAYKADGSPLPVVEWKATAALPSAGLEPITFPLLKLTDNHASGQVTLPTPGDWQLRFTLRLSEIDQDSVTATVPIS